MKEELHLVKGSVSKKSFIPILSHFHIYDGRIQGSNGRVTIDVRCDDLAGINATIPADKFVKAINSCKKDIFFDLTKVSMMVKSGAFKARIPLGNHSDYPTIDVSDCSFISLESAPILPVLRRLVPFIGEDASRSWSAGVLLKNGYAYATNNPVMARIPYSFPSNTTIPIYMINELLRIGIEPVGMAIDNESIFFNMGNSNWIKALGTGLKWPDVDSMFDSIRCQGMIEVPDGLAEAVNTVIPFCNNPKLPRIDFENGMVTTEDGDSRAMVSGIDLPKSSWRAENLLLILNEATKFDLTNYPNACPWVGNNIQGLIIGLRE